MPAKLPSSAVSSVEKKVSPWVEREIAPYFKKMESDLAEYFNEFLTPAGREAAAEALERSVQHGKGRPSNEAVTTLMDYIRKRPGMTSGTPSVPADAAFNPEGHAQAASAWDDLVRGADTAERVRANVGESQSARAAGLGAETRSRFAPGELEAIPDSPERTIRENLARSKEVRAFGSEAQARDAAGARAQEFDTRTRFSPDEAEVIPATKGEPKTPDFAMDSGIPDVDAAVGGAKRTLKDFSKTAAIAGAPAAALGGGALYSLNAGPGSGDRFTDPAARDKAGDFGPPGPSDDDLYSSPPKDDEEAPAEGAAEVEKKGPEDVAQESFHAGVEQTAKLGGTVSGHAAARMVGEVAKAGTPESFGKTLEALDKEAVTQFGTSVPTDKRVDLAVWQEKRDAIWDLYRENKSDLEWAQAAEVFGQLVVQWMAGAQGIRNGVDMTGVKFRLGDWSKRYDQLLAEASSELKSLKEGQEAEQHEIDQTNKAIADWRKRRADAAGDLTKFEGQSSIHAADAENAQNREAMQQAGQDRRTAINEAGANARSAASIAAQKEIAAGREAGKPVVGAAATNRALHARAEKDRKDFDNARARLATADILTKDPKTKEAIANAITQMGKVADDPDIIAMGEEYKKDSKAFAAKLPAWFPGSSDPKGDFLKKLDPIRQKLKEREDAAFANLQHGTGGTENGPNSGPGPGKPPGAAGKPANAVKIKQHPKTGAKYWVDADGKPLAEVK